MPDFFFEKTHQAQNPKAIIAGVDEVGCGPWAGPVVAAAVILPPHGLSIQDWIQDSKQLKPRKRLEVSDFLKNPDNGVFWSIGTAEVIEIDTINIRQASLLAMKRALEGLERTPTFVLVDGCHAPCVPYATQTVVKGDSLSLSIAAASIIAKVYRDDLMHALAKDYPAYGWEKNRGYGTAFHREALKNFGPTLHHRRSFAPISAMLA